MNLIIFDGYLGLDETCILRDTDADEDTDTSKFENESSSNSEVQLSYDHLILQKLKSCLAGVPPPPQLTYPQHKIEDILRLLNEPIHSESTKTGFFHANINCDQIVGETRPWPEVKQCIFFDISYNIDKTTEAIVDLCDKYRERYVGCETSSFVTSNSPSKYNGKKTNRRKMIGRSPRRLNYLTQRRKLFSSSSLKEACKTNTFGLAKKTILIPNDGNLKSSQKQTKRALFLTSEEHRTRNMEALRRSPSKVKSMEMRRSLWMQRKLPKKGTPRKQTPKKSTTPRKNATPKKQTTPGKRHPHLTPRKHTARKSRDYANFNENGKRSRSEVDSSDDCRTETNISELSDTQRRKLLWAVSAALGKVGIKQDHSKFRSYGRRLFRVCKQMWTNCSMNRTVKHGTSEQMLSLASEHINDVMKDVDEVKTENNDYLFSQDSNSCDFFSRTQDNNVD